MINFIFESTFGGSGTWNKIVPSDQSESYRGSYDNYIAFEIKGISGSVLIPQPHIINLNWSYLDQGTPNDALYLLRGKCTVRHAGMILEFIRGKKWQNKIKKAYSARNRWNDGRPC